MRIRRKSFVPRDNIKVEKKGNKLIITKKTGKLRKY